MSLSALSNSSVGNVAGPASPCAPQLRATIVRAQRPHPQARTATLIGGATAFQVGTAAPGVELIGYGEGRVVSLTKEFERRGVKSISFTDSKDWIQMCSVGIYGSIKGEDCIAALCGHKISLYTGRPSGQRTEDCPPSRCSGLSHVRMPPHLRTPPLVSHDRTPPHLRTSPYSDTSPRTEDAKDHRRRK